MSLLTAGRAAVMVGLVVTVVSLIAGFVFLFADVDQWAKRLLSLVPIGFLLLFAGLVTVVTTAPRSNNHE